MAKKVLRDVEIWFPKLVKPESFKGAPPAWSVQLRTRDEEKADEMEERGFTVKKIKPNKAKGEDFEPYWRANIKCKVDKADGTEREAPKVVDLSLDEIDPRTVGNGSVGNIQYLPWELERGGETLSGRILTKIQLTKHIVYEPKGDGEEDEDLELLEDQQTEVVESDEDDEDLY